MNPAAPPRPARVALISCVGEIGGAEVLLLETLEALDRREFLPSVIQLRPGPLEARARESGFPVTVLPAHRMRNLPAVVRTAWRIRQCVRTQGIDLLHSNAFRAHAYGALAARLAGLPEVVTVHSPEPGGWFTRAILAPRPGQVIANCDATAGWFRAHGWPAEVLWPGVNLRRLAAHTPRAELAARYQLDPGRPWVAMCSRLQPHKGQEYFLRALAALPRESGVQGVVVGAPLFGLNEEYLTGLRRLAEELGLGDRVRFVGFIPGPDVAGFQAASAVVVHSAVIEDFGLAVAEPMALGTPVVAFAAAGPAVIIAPGTGWLAPVGDQPALNQALREAMDSPELRARRGEAARARVRAHYTIEQHAAGTAAAYRRLLGRRPA